MSADVAPREPERFLGGQVIVRQPERGYRAAIDSVLLGAAAGLRPGERALELGCGAGTALLIAAWHAPRAQFVGVERDEALVALAQRNAAANGFQSQVAIEAGEVGALGPDLRDAFDVVFCNPPYLDADHTGRRPTDPARAAAFIADAAPFVAWVDAGLRALKSGGRFVLIQRSDRLGDAFGAFHPKAGEITMRALTPKADAIARRILIQARKGSKARPRLLPQLVLHEADGAFTSDVRAVLEGRARLGFEARALEPLAREA